jgi:hypothetical protein
MLRRLSSALVVMLLLSLSPALPAAAQEARCFPETGFCISGRIRSYWEQNGGLPVFGFPTGPQQLMNVEGRQVEAQWFERNRLELHPQNPAPYDVLLGRLGAQRLEQQGRNWQAGDRAASNAAELPGGGRCLAFAETGFRACGLFLDYFSRFGLNFPNTPGVTYAESLALFGLPLTNVQWETTPDGKYLLVQWFERARFEYHPNNPDPYKVLGGLLGNETLTALGSVCADVSANLAAAHQRADFAGAMGCAAPSAIVNAAVQYFERGRMIWVAAAAGRPAQIVVISESSGFRYQVFADSYNGQALNLPPPPAGLAQLQGGFAHLWLQNNVVRGDLGWAITPETATQAEVQYFSSGLLLSVADIPVSTPGTTRSVLVLGPQQSQVRFEDL